MKILYKLEFALVMFLYISVIFFVSFTYTAPNSVNSMSFVYN